MKQSRVHSVQVMLKIFDMGLKTFCGIPICNQSFGIIIVACGAITFEANDKT